MDAITLDASYPLFHMPAQTFQSQKTMNLSQLEPMA